MIIYKIKIKSSKKNHLINIIKIFNNKLKEQKIKIIFLQSINKKNKITILKSPLVNKTARNQFEINNFSNFFYFFYNKKKYNFFLLELLNFFTFNQIFFIIKQEYYI